MMANTFEDANPQEVTFTFNSQKQIFLTECDAVVAQKSRRSRIIDKSSFLNELVEGSTST